MDEGSGLGSARRGGRLPPETGASRIARYGGEAATASGLLRPHQPTD
jgi:hypothetical protein